MNKSKLKTAVIGASGAVGRELLFLLEKRKFPFGELILFNSGKKKEFLEFKGKKISCRIPSFGELKKADIAFFASTDEISAEFAPKLAGSGIWCVDDSSKFRLNKAVPLVIPEVNADKITKNTRLISGPNCTTTAVALALWEIHKRFKIREIRFATYQAISGAGKKATDQFKAEIKSYSSDGKIRAVKNKCFRHPIAINLFPHVGDFDKTGTSTEETKMEVELKKIWGDSDIRVSSFCVRVPVMRVHSIAAWVKTRKKWTLRDLRAVFNKTKGIKFSDKDYVTPLMAEKKELTYVNRLQKTFIFPTEFKIWISMDNLYKGAALNSIQIGEYLIGKEYLCK